MIVGCAIGVVVVLAICWAFHLLSRPEKPWILARTDAQFWHNVLARCPILDAVYRPPVIWGRSGHIQSGVYAAYGRFNAPLPNGDRHSVILSDGATLTFEVFEALMQHDSKRDVTIIICGGIGNGSHSAYIRTMTLFAQSKGFRVVVLNHLAANYSIPLTSPRMFCFGNTEELAAVVDFTVKTFPNSRLILVGFSMGGNIVLKYLGEQPERQRKFVCALSICQGYCANKGYAALMRTWKHWRRLYLRFMARGLKRTLRRHKDVLFSDEAQKRYGPINVDKVFSATSLVDIDREYISKMCGFKRVEDYYHWCSSANYFDKIKQIPVLLMNSKDDPIIPEELQSIALKFTESASNVVFVGTKHGGHLGFFESGWIWPNDLSWLDRFIVEICNSVVEEDSVITNRVNSRKLL